MPQRHNILNWLTLLSLGILCFNIMGTAQAQSSIKVDDNLTQRNISPIVQYYGDPTTRLSLEQVKALPEDVWRQTDANALSFGFTDDIYWLRLEIDNRLRTKPYLLHVDYPTFDDLQMTLESAGTSIHFKNGFLIAPEDKPIPDRHHLFQMPTEEVTSIWLRAANTGAFQLPLSLWDEAAYQEAESYDMLYYGLYFGVWLILIFFNGVMFLAFRHSAFASFLSLVTAFGLYQLAALGFGAEQWAELRDAYNHLMLFAIGLGMVFACMFFDKALVLEQTQPLARNVLRALSAMVLLGLLSHIIFDYHTVLPFIAALTIPISLIIIATSLQLASAGNRFAIYCCVAWVTFFVGITIQALSRFGVIDSNFMTERSVSLGFLIMTITMTITFAMELRNRYVLRAQIELTQQNGDVMDESIRAQEQSVLERMMSSRTDELEQALQELSVAHEALKELNTVDAVTGAKNRHYFDTVFDQEWKRASREGYPLSLLMLDVDHFKVINDTHGHLVGDECLKQIAAKVTNHLKRPADILARYGGEEFVVLLPYIENHNALQLAEQIRAEFDQSTFGVDGKKITIKLSIGLCTVTPTEKDDPKDIVSAADIALYEAKGAGRNQVRNAGQLTVHNSGRSQNPPS